MTERQRRIASWAGLALWVMFPFVYLAGTHARWAHRCEGRSFTGSFDDCFNDALPIFELLAFPLTLLLAYPFARLAFSMFGPEIDARASKWRLAAGDGGAAYYPAFQIACVVGLLWAGLHLASVPFVPQYWYLIGYWAAWIGWFLLGALASLPASLRSSINGS